MDNQHHIAAIEPSGRLYGSEYCLLDILDGTDPNRFRWTVLLPRGNGFDELLRQRDIRCEFIIPASLGNSGKLRRASVYGRMLWRLWRMHPDLLYVNQAGSLRAANVMAKVLGLPVVCQVQTLEDARWLSERQHLQRCVQAFVCNSEYIADQTRVAEEKKCVLYQGIPEHRLTRAIENAGLPRAKQSQEPFAIGILGRIAVSKGHYLLLEAAKHLLADGMDCRFVVIGEGLTSADTKAYRDEVQRAGLASRFEFRGYRTDLQHELGRLDVLAIPSIAEPLGRVLFDAAEFGVPVVVADSGGLGEVSTRFSIGVRFQAENDESLAEALLQTAKNYEQVASSFQTTAVEMFRRLANDTYMETMQRILQSAVSSQKTSETWLGDK
ncbi:2-deoxystreptamine glucosyltransferase [Rosistilla ulvae]|uniref:2-deoxystreptamine glucosyltransferase n=2 Tax=Rosistilla ulvae TaxID=1930277 RepID=A0A517M1Y8_9BACT|nr:2-deoxystreptamine glucosyltransferase [Rosistilla ulvae]